MNGLNCVLLTSTALIEIVSDSIGALSAWNLLYTASLSKPLRPYSRPVCEPVANECEGEPSECFETYLDHSD